ncbi:MAG: NAD-dependent deacylase [Candidatus Ancillula sp.]|jgi:NAD-dependent deacetylase|nr:NAD-dependent deacylase [Candidatus Ancillula sp.]
MLKTQNEELNKILENSKKIVFFGGAGVSTESGIPDFRSQDGLYNQEYDYPPETILSWTFFRDNPKEFYRFYRDKMLGMDHPVSSAATPPEEGNFGYQPNNAHKWLAENKIPVLTQNIDGLHSIALGVDPSENQLKYDICELHGSIWRNHCSKCGKFYGLEKIEKSVNEKDGIPRCTNTGMSGLECKGIIKPDVVLYEEGLPSDVWSRAEQLIAEADTMIVGGTSLIVYPAAGLVRLFASKEIGGKSRKLVVINRDQSPADSWADLSIHGSIGEVLN